VPVQRTTQEKLATSTRPSRTIAERKNLIRGGRGPLTGPNGAERAMVGPV
jgi:hypothetical protein